MASPHATPVPKALERRLLSDIAEMQQDPYPNVHLHFDDANVRQACLVLSPENEQPLHLTIVFHDDYPLNAPTVTIQTKIEHPNVFDSYICATMLNTEEGWTSAYTLKGIVIQLLSFFTSDSLEQDHGGGTINLTSFRSGTAAWRRQTGQGAGGLAPYRCQTCGFGPDWRPTQINEMEIDQPLVPWTKPPANNTEPIRKDSKLFSLPDEIVLLIFDALDTRDILSFGEAVPTIKTMANSYDFIRIRELQCFCLKQSFMETKLGIGVTVVASRRPIFRSEFDLLSQEAFFQHGVRRSIQGVHFDQWLPLPLLRRHWNVVRTNATSCMKGLHEYARMDSKEPGHVDVLYNFMNTIVVQFSSDAEKGFNGPDSRSTLSHASEKAVEAYFGLYHLLLCLATEDPSIVTGADGIVTRFLTGPRGKTQFADLGHVLVASLISTIGLTEELIFLIIKEAILRNVVWMLDIKGAGFAELAYLEPSAVSEYRVTKTFAASPTSYRLLMFLKLFSSAARPADKTLVQIRETLFDTHGAPPNGLSAIMAQSIRQIHAINGFPGFLAAMGITKMPSKSEFTAFLQRTINESVLAGYSSMPMNQSQLYMIRRVKEPDVEISPHVNVTPGLERWFNEGEKWYENGWCGRPSFFPNQGGTTGNSGGRYGRGNGGGYGRGGGGGYDRGGGSGWRGNLRGGRGRGYGRGGRG